MYWFGCFRVGAGAENIRNFEKVECSQNKLALHIPSSPSILGGASVFVVTLRPPPRLTRDLPPGGGVGGGRSAARSVVIVSGDSPAFSV